MSDRPPRRESSDLFSHIDLRQARLCLDCEAIFAGPECPACTSQSFVPLTRWIRPAQVPAAEQRAAAQTVSKTGARRGRLLKKSLYVGLGAYGMWKMLFEPSKPRKPRRPKKEPDQEA